MRFDLLLLKQGRTAHDEQVRHFAGPYVRHADADTPACLPMNSWLRIGVLTNDR